MVPSVIKKSVLIAVTIVHSNLLTYQNVRKLCKGKKVAKKVHLLESVIEMKTRLVIVELTPLSSKYFNKG